MKTEYCMKLLLSPHSHDNKENPYFWCVLKYDDEWHQIACGWESSPDLCYESVKQKFNHLF